jgi:Leucine-rich repeat (LRR) protein
MHLHDLTGIQYFKNLDSLRLNADTMLSNIPALPQHLKVFECRNNYLDSLPPLPDSLQRFVCDFNSISQLPALPPTLQYLSCINNHLSTLPALPSGIRVLYCSGNQLDSLPGTLPDSLVLLSCYSNKLSVLPALPASLTQLLCSSNLLGSLPVLPASLANLSCYANHISSLPVLPASLNFLSCNRNNLTSLPTLPNSLTSLNCEYNQLSALPDLPDSLSILYCDNNPNLQCFPLLKTIGDLEFYNTAITCAPNYGNVGSSNPSLDALPLCLEGNVNGCLWISGINEIEKPSFTIYPNPAKDFVTITVSEGAVTLQLTDLSGREILKQPITNSPFRLSTKQLPAGLYFINITDRKGRMAANKLAVE